LHSFDKVLFDIQYEKLEIHDGEVLTIGKKKKNQTPEFGSSSIEGKEQAHTLSLPHSFFPLCQSF